MVRLRITLLLALLFLAAAAPVASEARIVPPRPMVTAPLAMDWDWDWGGFKSFWRKQLSKTTGAVGVVGLIVGIGALIIMSAKKKT